MARNRYIFRSVVVKVTPVFKCTVCGVEQLGSTAKFECVDLDDLQGELAQGVHPTHMPVGWAANGRTDYRCPDHITQTTRPIIGLKLETK